jgi:hypothetical protein
LFEVVQQEQEGSRVLQLVADELGDGAVANLLDFERIGKSRCYQVGLCDRRQADKLNARGESICNRGAYGRTENESRSSRWPPGNRDEDVLSSIAARLARLDRELTPNDRTALSEKGR